MCLKTGDESVFRVHDHEYSVYIVAKAKKIEKKGKRKKGEGEEETWHSAGKKRC